ncbi:LysR substrate-binding domain-containing protein [Streptomyces sp. NPDC048182]|uniref:LysR family transcriptional regulator n=1 Tax=Streptomyces sp. NPDC048182 TaxID=3365507 RepID=UPI0037205973
MDPATAGPLARLNRRTRCRAARRGARRTPARVSQSIRRTERRVGAPLFDRTTRRVRLTALGEQLRRELGAGYRQIRDGIETTARAASGNRGTLVLGLMGPHRWMMDDAVRLFRDRNPNTQVEFREIQPASPLDPLRAKTVDVALLWQPVREPDLTVGPVTHISPVHLMTAAAHPYAERDAIRLEDLGEHSKRPSSPSTRPRAAPSRAARYRPPGTSRRPSSPPAGEWSASRPRPPASTPGQAWPSYRSRTPRPCPGPWSGAPPTRRP